MTETLDTWNPHYWRRFWRWALIPPVCLLVGYWATFLVLWVTHG